jgi:hypothetical protein
MTLRAFIPSRITTIPPNGTPALVRDLGTVTFGPDIREGVAEWQGEGETVVFGDDDVERTLDRFRFCLFPQRSVGALELSRV